MGFYQEGLSDIDKAIQNSEDNLAQYFYLRGHILGCCKQYKQAQYDLSICLQLDENFSDAYLERAKNNYFLEEHDSTFSDMQKYIQLKPQDQQIHFWAGNLLFNSGAIEDAIKAYSHCEQINKQENLLLERIKCNIILKNFQQAIQDINKVIILNNFLFQNSQLYKVDLACLNSLKSLSFEYFFKAQKNGFKENISQLKKLSDKENLKSMIFTQNHIYLYLGAFLLFNEIYHEAIIFFKKGLQNFQKANQSQDQKDNSTIKYLNDNNIILDYYFNIILAYILVFNFLFFIYNFFTFLLILKLFRIINLMKHIKHVKELNRFQIININKYSYYQMNQLLQK
ncbi:hypothetical protein IMG5_007640 [Ichthyophthirius multifiliis]|uniref:Tetratricopeptide repeat protein n=1 Tax=Ichthyophthirius multifiliis TaxID=5932 RepID=G0QJQ4_ICHMU|nr:hypothetical protein IMG5_007640 [Ichthyophthirius multifiliis]EGR34552.1 hypothetical protein IMG5_007640 [Ichthyophthirius multifiliis]|eukprot:XP_004039856.1 hypothetical protein IMG5_007640 [Ichthyophthirius multifiliis]